MTHISIPSLVPDLAGDPIFHFEENHGKLPDTVQIFRHVGGVLHKGKTDFFTLHEIAMGEGTANQPMLEWYFNSKPGFPDVIGPEVVSVLVGEIKVFVAETIRGLLLRNITSLEADEFLAAYGNIFSE